jgi:hypothetical protein
MILTLILSKIFTTLSIASQQFVFIFFLCLDKYMIIKDILTRKFNRNSTKISLAMIVIMTVVRQFKFNTDLNRLLSVITVFLIVFLFLQQQELLIQKVKNIFRSKE